MHTNESAWQILRPSLIRFFLLTALLGTAIGAIFYEGMRGGGTFGESSPVEYMQELLMALTASLFFLLAIRDPEKRGFLVLVGGFFTCITIRELDGLLDTIGHGFWKYPAWLVAISAITCAIRSKGSGLQLAKYTQHASFGLMLGGIVSLLLFSRLFGSGDLWRTFMGDNYMRPVKDLAEEGTELLSYCLIFFSAAWYYCSELAASRSRSRRLA